MVAASEVCLKCVLKFIFSYLETMQHLLGSLVPSLLLLILVSSLTFLFLRSIDSHKSSVAHNHTTHLSDLNILEQILLFTSYCDLCSFVKAKQHESLLSNAKLQSSRESSSFAPHLFLVAVILLVFALLTEEVKLWDKLGEVDAALLRGQIHLRHI